MPYLILIDSKDRIVSTQTTSNFTVKLNTNYAVDRIRFKKIQIPFSYYPYDPNDSTTSTLVFNEGAGDISVVIGFPTTSWLPQNIVNALCDAMTSSGTQSYTGTYNEVTGKWTITASVSNFTMKWASSSTGLNKIFGFNSSDTQYTGNTTYTSTNMVAVYGPPYLLLFSSALTSQTSDKCNGFQGSTTFTGSSDNVLYDSKNLYLTIPVNTAIFGQIDQSDGSIGERIIEYSRDPSSCRSNQFLSTIDIQILNPWTNKPLGLNGMDIQLELEAVGR